MGHNMRISLDQELTTLKKSGTTKGMRKEGATLIHSVGIKERGWGNGNDQGNNKGDRQRGEGGEGTEWGD